MQIKFASQATRTLESVAGSPVQIIADAKSFRLAELNAGKRDLKNCLPFEISKVNLTVSVTSAWLYLYFNDGDMIELRGRSMVINEYRQLVHQIRLLIAESKRSEKAKLNPSSRLKLQNSLNALFDAGVISDRERDTFEERMLDMGPRLSSD